MDIYDRQIPLELKIPEVATIVGCGGTGFWVGVFLAMSGCKKLILIDPDCVDVTNRNRMPVTQDRVSRQKTSVLSDYIKNLRSEAKIETYDYKIEKDHQLVLLQGTIFCCTDNIKSQQLICAYCKIKKIPYQRCGYDGTILNVSNSMPLTFQVPDEILEGYTFAPSWVVPAAMAACGAVFSQMKSKISLTNEIEKLTTFDSTCIPEVILTNNKEKILEKVLENPCLYDLGDCDNCDRGDCDNCDRIDVENNEDYGYCQDCDHKDCDYTQSDLDEEYDRGYETGITKGREIAEKEREV